MIIKRSEIGYVVVDGIKDVAEFTTFIEAQRFLSMGKIGSNKELGFNPKVINNEVVEGHQVLIGDFRYKGCGNVIW